MPYTLAKGFAWIALAMLIGIVIGWLLRSIVAKRQVARARAHNLDTAEMERLRGRVANLEPVVVERDRLREDLAALRAGDADADTAATSPTPVSAPAGASRSVSTTASVAASVPLSDDAPLSAVVGTPPAAPDVTRAASVLGRTVVLDDLKVVEGIGPKIESLCHGIGIRTWFDLATTEVSLLRTMLADAGARFRTHDPATWPQQADLLANGRWEEFKSLTDELQGGRTVD